MILLELFWSFCKIGFTSFGGLSMVPLISHEMLTHQWMSTSEVSDIVAIAEMTPWPAGAELRHLRRHPGGRAGRRRQRQPRCPLPYPAGLRHCRRDV